MPPRGEYGPIGPSKQNYTPTGSCDMPPRGEYGPIEPFNGTYPPGVDMILLIIKLYIFYSGVLLILKKNFHRIYKINGINIFIRFKLVYL